MSEVRLGPVVTVMKLGKRTPYFFRNNASASDKSATNCSRLATTKWFGGSTDNARPPALFAVNTTDPNRATNASQCVTAKSNPSKAIPPRAVSNLAASASVPV